MAAYERASLQRQGLISDKQAAKLPDAPEPLEAAEPDADEGPEPDGDEGDAVGLCQNPEGVLFQCGTCNYFKSGVCQNPNPKLSGQQVDGDTMCCNKYEHNEMKTVVP